MKPKTKNKVESCLMVLMVYIMAATLTFALKHPKLTGTQRLLNFWHAMTWQELDR